MLIALRQHKTIFLTIITAILLTYRITEAVQMVPYSIELSAVKISKHRQTMIRFPEHIRKAFVSDNVPIEIQLENKEAYLKFEKSYSKTINAFFIGDKETYSLMLVPSDIRDAVVYIHGPENIEEGAIEWEKGNVYEEMLAELTRMIYHGKIPPGYKAKTGGKDESPYNEIKMTRELTLTGALYKIIQYRLENISQTESSYSEEEFYRPGVAAISIKKHRLGPGDVTRMYVITREYD